MKVTPAKRMLKRAARAKLMVSLASTSCRAVAWSAAGAVVQASAMSLVARPSRVTRISPTVMPATAATDPSRARAAGRPSWMEWAMATGRPA
jgi:hypothetical protein